MTDFYDSDWSEDWVGKWISILQSHHEYTDIVYGTNPDDITYLDHAVYDGVGGFAHLLKAQGHDQEELPELQNGVDYWTFKSVFGLLRYLQDGNINRINWKKRSLNKKGLAQKPIFKHFTAEETKKILLHAKNEGVTLTTLVLANLDSTIRNHLYKDLKQKSRWLIPINMRGPINRKEATTNHASYFGVNISQNSNLHNIGLSLKHAIDIRYHWFAWWGMMIGKWFGFKTMQKMLGKYYKKDHSWTGTLSNLGSWKVPESTESWYFCPPATRTQPVAMGVVSVNGKLSLSLQFHPSGEVTDEQRNQLFEEMNQQLLEIDATKN